ncbi:unnamed protein product [Acanthoscelides obtectus]|uniref:Metaxin-1 n=1 Tax=Acanthoscelides obtectus TaxID=200917 RepID=A0A9P0L851_ACAOB|nr:unnamed protein product [Acanthoscelides obtectus]CAK1644130.1 Metaxin-3 [Acanthoscelides obtectus]
MGSDEKFKLVAYESDFSMPSMNVECTKSIVYTAAVKVSVQLKPLNSIKQCLFYSEPCFIHGNLRFKSFADTVLYLRTLNFNLDSNLDKKQCCESLALCNLVQSKLKPVIEFVYWVDPRNCEEFTNVWYMRALPLPFNYWHMRRLKQKAELLIETLYPTESNLEIVREFLNKTAVECLSSLSTRLGKSEYFYGSLPSTLDVVVYSHIAPLVKVPFPSNEISNLVTMWPNLVDLVKRIDAAYFRELPKDSKYFKEVQRVKSNDDDVSYVAVLLLTISAASLVVGFAINRGYI